MKARNKWTIIMLLLFSMMLMAGGCQLSGGGVTRSASPEGVTLSFIPGSPPDVIREDSGFIVGVKLENNADITINSAKICARGILSDYGGFPVEEQCTDFNLAGVEVRNNKQIVKDSKPFYFNSEGYKTNGRSIIEPTIIAKATYGCEFIAGPQLCVTKDLMTDEIGGGECARTESISGSKLYSKSAPITLMKADKELSNSGDGNLRLRVGLTLKKAGDGGYVVNSLNDDEVQKSYVKMQVSYGSYGDMKCSGLKDGNMEWKRNENEKVINCEILLGSVNQLESAPLNVKLNYYYRVEKQKMIKVEGIKSDENLGGEV